MDQVTRVKNQFHAEQWIQLIKECQSRGMRVDDWCTANDISRHAYYYWLRKLRYLTHRLPLSYVLMVQPLRLMKAPASRPFRQCFLHCRAYVR